MPAPEEVHEAAERIDRSERDGVVDRCADPAERAMAGESGEAFGVRCRHESLIERWCGQPENDVHHGAVRRRGAARVEAAARVNATVKASRLLSIDRVHCGQSADLVAQPPGYQ